MKLNYKKIRNKKMPRKLYSLYTDSGARVEGSLLDTEIQWGQMQIEFLYKQLIKIKPKVILETGTHCAHFSYFVKVIAKLDTKIYTFGDQQQSNLCTDLLNNKYGKFITFQLGDSTESLTNFFSDDKIDLAWIDGGHNYNVALSDLKNCARLDIPYILVDDINQVNRVGAAVTEFLSLYSYKLIKQSKECNRWEWGGTYLLQRYNNE